MSGYIDDNNQSYGRRVGSASGEPAGVSHETKANYFSKV